jgi:small subunit ribosomal protein S9
MPSAEALRGLRKALRLLNGSPTVPPKAGRTQGKQHLLQSSTRQYSSCLAFRQEQQEINAAPEIEFKNSTNDQSEASLPLLKRIRIVPASPSYFTGKPFFTDDLLSLQAILRKYQTLPIVDSSLAPRVAWKSVTEYKNTTDEEHVKSGSYSKLIQVLKRLNQIHPSVMPAEVMEAMEKFKRDVQPFVNIPNQHFVDMYGRSMGVGRRKTSTARAWLVEGDGEVLVNGKTLTQMFGRLHDRESAIWALKSTERVDKYNVFALVQGGGVTGQAEALTLAIGKALLVQEPALKPALRRGEFLDSIPHVFHFTLAWRIFRLLLRLVSKPHCRWLSHRKYAEFAR